MKSQELYQALIAKGYDEDTIYSYLDIVNDMTSLKAAIAATTVEAFEAWING